MSRYQVFNGQYFPENEPLVHATNRGFNYGDGFFESIRVSNGKAPFIQLHWNRLQRACQILQITIPEELTLKTFHNQVLFLADRNGESNSRIRFQGFRQGAGRYTPEASQLGWSITSLPLETSHYVLNKTGLKVEVCRTHTINPAPQSTFKSTNSIPYVLASIEKQKRGLDDVFLTDSEGFLAEATGSNIFLVKDKMLLTPDLSNGGVAGVMRNVVIAVAKEAGFQIKEGLLKMDDALEADECFLTNATRGLQWVGAINKKRYFKRISSKLTDTINQKFVLIS